MKTLFFLVVIANVALFMWEYKAGAFAPVIETTSQNTDLNQEQILLVSELKNIPQPIIPAPVSEMSVTETALIEETGTVSEVLPLAAEGIDKSAIPAPVSKPPVTENALIEETGIVNEVLPLAAEGIDKYVIPAPVSKPLVTENALIEETGIVSEVLPLAAEGIDKSAIPAPVSKPPVTETALIEETGILNEVLPLAAEGIDKSAIPAPVSRPPATETALIEETGTVSDVLPATESIDKSALKDSVVKETAMRCYEVGPFANNKAYQAWTNRLKDIESDIKQVSRDEQIASSYVVYYPAAETVAQSEADIRMLKNHGIKDLWLLTGEDKNNISLGVFSTEASALTMKSELLAKGINAEVKVRYKIKVLKYALIKGEDKLMERLDALKKTYPQLAVKQIPDATTQGCR